MRESLVKQVGNYFVNSQASFLKFCDSFSVFEDNQKGSHQKWVENELVEKVDAEM